MMIWVPQQGDLNRCVAVLADVHASDSHPMRWPADPANWPTPTDVLTAWVAEYEGNLVGHGALWRPADDQSPGARPTLPVLTGA